MRPLRTPPAIGLILLLLLVSPVSAADEAGIAFFEKKVRPVLVQHCYACHSAEAQAKKKLRGGLRLDTKEGLLQGGDSGPAIVPGKAKESLLIKSLHYDGDLKMPPKGKLPDRVLADLAAWIDRGAPDPRSGEVVKRQIGLSVEQGRQFWAYKPRSTPVVPIGSSEQKRGSLDAFLLEKLEAKSLHFALPADPAILIRRLYFDLLGMPPPPEEVDAFVRDSRPDAYERLVDRLLASPHFGERWGRHWLDLARYAESLTLRGFVMAQAWRYRDYVIENFNDDVPLDRFFREQLAGDLLPAATLEQRRRQWIATTFLTLGNTNLEEQDKKQLVMDVVDEQLDTIGRAMLAQTIGCARCHDHKFDPIPTKDYYALAGILRNTRTLKHANVSMWLEFPLPGDPQQERAVAAHEKALAALQQQIQALKGTDKPAKPGKRVVAVTDLPGIVVDDSQARKVGTWKQSTYSGHYVGAGYVHDENSQKGEKTITFQPIIPRTGKYEVRLAYSAGTNRATKVPITIFSADGEKTIEINQQKAPEIDGLFLSLGQYTFEKSSQGFVMLANEDTKGHVIADAVVFLPVEDLAPQKEKKPTKGTSAKAADKGEKLKQLEARLKRMQTNGPRREMVMSVEEEKVIEDVRVHVRGSVHNLGEKAPRGVLQVAQQGAPVRFPEKESGRRELAAWLTSPDNPLTARVYVNRAWHWLFGSGLVRTVDNFGTTGERPSHPELLDHLANQFVADGWSVKRLVRRIVLSRAYQQSSQVEERGWRIDPENRLFGRANRRRLEAECIRDAMLLVSGQLRLEQGGPTYRPGLASDYGYKHTDTRRSVYAPVFRNSLPELFEVFDFADSSVTTGKRNVSTVAPQALFLTNHPFVLEQARHAARRLLALPVREDAVRLEQLYRLALGRLPTEKERRLLEEYVGSVPSTQREDAWAQVCQVVFASIDFRYVN